VTGGSGGIGRALLKQLIDRYQVTALFRAETAVSAEWRRRGCAVVIGDLNDQQALTELVRGARYVFHCAAVVGGSLEQSQQVNVGGTRRLALAAAANGCQRFIHVSSIAVYPSDIGNADISEDIPLHEDDEMAVYSLTKLRAEQAVIDIASQHGLEYTILRPTCVYGPHVKSYTLVPIALIGKGMPVVLGDGKAFLDAVYVDDVVQALLLAARSPRANGEVFNIGHDHVTLNDFYRHYSRMLNRPLRHLPVGPVSAAARVLGVIPGAQKASVASLRKGARFLIRSSQNIRRICSAKAATLLGYAPQFPLPIGMLKTELWLKRRGVIPAARPSLDGYGPLQFQPMAVVHPDNEAQLVQVVRMATTANVQVKAIGSLHSQCPIPETDGICVVLDRYNQLITVDGSLVTVQSGMKIRDLNAALAPLQLALAIMGSIVEQTISGAISTATHGGSIHHGSLSDYVEAIRIVRADGSIIDLGRSHEMFAAAVVSLGLLGIVSTVTLRCVPAFRLESRNRVRKAREVIDDFDRIQRSSRYLDMLYFPMTDDIEMLSIERSEDGGSHDPQPEMPSPPQASGALATIGQRLAIAGVKRVADMIYRRRWQSLQRFVTSRSVGSSYRPGVGRSDLVLAFTDVAGARRSPAVLQDMEIAVPYEQAQAALNAVREHFRTTQRYPLLPIHIRCSARSELWLSPAYHRDVCWMEFWQFPHSDTAFKQIHELLAPFHYRFHWGKETGAGREYIRQQYERWDDFVRLRAEWDPDGRFANSYTDSFLEPNGADLPAIRVEADAVPAG
jgi:L-gulonolactone oxidase